MVQRSFKGKYLPLLGFGAMRLPLTGESATAIDEAVVDEMVKYAYDHGVRYFDTAYPYHGGESERVMGWLLKQFPRDSYYLATKYPGHQISSSYNPREIFEEQLEKCAVDYFDYYLLHNVYEGSIETYLDPRWKIIDYFLEQKNAGRIRHFGFSSHGSHENTKQFLDKYGNCMEFCQIQLNYVDWTLQDAKSMYELLTARGMPIWVMEPVRGGRLADLSEEEESKLKAKRPNESVAAWCFRWLMTLPNVTMILSGMSNMAQVVDNVKTFTNDKPLTGDEIELLLDIAEGMKDSLPCTSCRYCVDDCPQGLNIPLLLDLCNQLRFSPHFNVGMTVESMPEGKRHVACTACAKCVLTCPQKIDIPAAMRGAVEALAKLPSWAEICRQRDEAARAGKNK